MVDFEYPFDELAERAVLGAMIKDPESIPTVLEHLREEDFYFETHRLLFSVLYKVWEDKGKDWDDIVLRSYLEKRGLLDKISMDLVYTLAHEAAEGQLLFEAIRSVKEKAGLRRLMDLSIEVLKSAQSSPDLNLLVERAIDRLQKIAEKYQPSGYSHVKEATNRVLEFLDKRRNAERLITGVPSGFLGLDTLTAGFQPSDRDCSKNPNPLTHKSFKTKI